MAKITREKFKTYEGVFDQFTIRNLFDLSSKGIIDELSSPIALGKEAHVFMATRGDGLVAVKIYRLENCDFNKMQEYMRRDSRYMNVSSSRRKVIFSWTQREYRNLMKAREVGVRAPLPLYFKDNILVEEFIGVEKVAAPKLKDFVPRNTRQVFSEVISMLKRYYDAGYVHGDLSEFNILMDKGPVFIDFSQAMPRTDDADKQIITRDILNVCRFFAKYILVGDAQNIVKKII